MTAKLLVLYGHPEDPNAFDSYYRETHIPLVKAVPDLRSITISAGPVGTPAGPSDVHRVATLTWDSIAELQAALGSPAGGEAAGDLANFASGGATLLVFEEQDV